MLTIVFWRDKDMTTDAVVRPDGKITLPLINEIDAANLTPDQLRDKITAAATKYMEDPTVTVVVKAINSRKVCITGAVAKPACYPLTQSMTVMQLIATAGGVLEFARRRFAAAVLERTGATPARAAFRCRRRG